jgi:hypothetical protein
VHPRLNSRSVVQTGCQASSQGNRDARRRPQTAPENCAAELRTGPLGPDSSRMGLPRFALSPARRPLAVEEPQFHSSSHIADLLREQGRMSQFPLKRGFSRPQRNLRLRPDEVDRRTEASQLPWDPQGLCHLPSRSVVRTRLRRRAVVTWAAHPHAADVTE